MAQIIKVCETCSKEFKVYPYRNRAKFCCVKCRAQSPKYKNKNHNHWKGGKPKFAGYIFVYNPSHPNCINKRYVFEHRLVMEKHLGRYLESHERIHHINGIKNDNRIENLMLFKNESEHQKYHNKIKWIRH